MQTPVVYHYVTCDPTDLPPLQKPAWSQVSHYVEQIYGNSGSEGISLINWQSNY